MEIKEFKQFISDNDIKHGDFITLSYYSVNRNKNIYLIKVYDVYRTMRDKYEKIWGYNSLEFDDPNEKVYDRQSYVETNEIVDIRVSNEEDEKKYFNKIGFFED